MDRRSLLLRVLTAVVGIPLLLGAAWLGGWWWATVVIGLAFIGAVEYTRLVPGVRITPLVLGVAVVILILGRPLESQAQFWISAIGTLLLFAAGILPPVLAGRPDHAGALRDPLGATVVGWAYIGIPAGILIQLDLLFLSSFWVVLWIFAVIWANDIAAYFVGYAIGRHKLAPHLSPGKSWEGAIAGLVAGVVIGAGLGSWTALSSLTQTAVAGGIVTVAAQLGDLFESAIKRRAGAKDSGVVFPGHGGVLDRFDGVFAAVPLAYVVLVSLRAGVL